MFLVVIAENEHFQYLTPAQELVCFSVANFFYSILTMVQFYFYHKRLSSQTPKRKNCAPKMRILGISIHSEKMLNCFLSAS